MLAIKFYPLDCDKLLLYTIQDCFFFFWPRSSHLNYFGEPYILPLREQFFVEQHIFLEENIVRKFMKILLQKKNLKSRLWRRLMKTLV